MKQEFQNLPCAVILTAIPVEFEAVQCHLTELKEEILPDGTIYDRGKFSANGQSWEVGLAEIGAGNTEAAVATKRAIDYFKPSVVLFVGVAGGIKDVILGDVVAATKVYGYESGKVVDEGFLPRPSLGSASYALEQRAKKEAKRSDWIKRIKGAVTSQQPKAIIGAIAAGEKVVASTTSDIYKLLRSNYSDTLAVEMEGYGFLKAMRANPKINALVIRGISDLIDGKSGADANGSQEIAARHASAFAFEILAKLKPEQASIYEVFFNRACEKSEKKDRQGAIEDYSKTIRLNSYAYNNRGNDRSALGDYQGAIEDYNEAIRLNPDDSSAYNNRGLVRAFSGDCQGAIEDYNEAIQLNPNDSSAYINRANVRSMLGDEQGAIEDYTKAIQMEPEFDRAYLYRAVSRSALGDKQGAIEDCTEAIRINPEYAQAYYCRGIDRSVIGDSQGAIEDYSETMRWNFTLASICYNNRGIEYCTLGHYQRAVENFNQAIQLNPNHAPFYYNRGLAQSKLSNTQAAIKDYQKAASLYLQSGETQGSQDMLNKIKELQL